MESGWSVMMLLLIAAAVAWFWQSSLAARASANAAAADACDRLSLQLLDGTVAFARMSLARDRYGRLALQRTYVFDYTADSIARRQGFVVLTGQEVESVGYAPGEASRAAPAAQPPQAPPIEAESISGSSSNVLNLEDWRARHRKTPDQDPQPREDRGDGRQ
jgi:Protein of unknown function (DUF3301)